MRATIGYASAIFLAALSLVGCKHRGDGGTGGYGKLEGPVRVEGKYWSAYFAGPSADPSMANFMLFGIFSAEFRKNGQFVAPDYGDGTWKLVDDHTVELTTKQGKLSLVASDGGDVLTAKSGQNFGMDNNYIRFLRDNPESRKRIIGTYKATKRGTEMSRAPTELTFTNEKVSSSPSGQWIAAGDYVVLLGRKDSAYMHPSLVFRVLDDGKTLTFKPSDPQPEFSPAKWEITYSRNP